MCGLSYLKGVGIQMDEWQALSAYDWAFWVAGLFALLEFGRWLYSMKDFILKTVGIKTKGMLKREEYANRLKQVETSIEEIKNTSKHNVAMFIDHEGQVVDKFMDIKSEIVSELNKLHDKIDEQADIIDKNNKATIQTDCAMLRDRLNSGMRYFTQNTDEKGNVHIKLGDYQTMDALFKEYFSKGGNGAFEKMYNDEFTHFIIDR